MIGTDERCKRNEATSFAAQDFLKETKCFPSGGVLAVAQNEDSDVDYSFKPSLASAQSSIDSDSIVGAPGSDSKHRGALVRSLAILCFTASCEGLGAHP